MKIGFINGLALLLCLGSMACSGPGSTDEQGGDNGWDLAYAQQSLDAHRAIRKALSQIVVNMPQYRDTASYVQELFPNMLYLDSLISTLPMEGMKTGKDTLMHSASDRLFNSYHELMNIEFRLLFSRYQESGGNLELSDQRFIDSLWQTARTKDEWALDNYRRFLPKDSSIQFDLQPLIP